MPHRAAANFILIHRQALAQAGVARQYDRQPELRQRYGESGAAKCVQDTEYHLAYLAVAVKFSSPALFKDYIGWVKTVLTVRKIHLEDVENNLACLWTVLQEQLPEGCAAAVQPYIEDAFQVQPQGPSDLPTLLGSDDDLTAIARKYLQAILRAERHEASRLIREAFQGGVTITDLYLQVFQRCQREIGRLWLLNQVTVAQEHYCTAATQLVMAQFYPYLFSLPKNGRRLVATSVAGELHEVGLRIVTDLFEANGWNTAYFGANVPAQSLVQSLGQHQADLLAISVTMAYHLPAVEEVIALVRSETGDPAVKIMVGGYPFNLDPELWRRVGADGHARDASEALDVAACLLSIQKPSEREQRTSYTTGRPSQVSGISNVSPSQTEVAVYGELSRLNNELLTAQRELAQKNAHLERLNEQFVEGNRRKDELLALLARDALLLANVRDALIVTDLNGIVTYWNEGATQLFGWTAEEMIGRPYADRFPEPTRSFILAQIRERAEGSVWDAEFEDYRKDGSRVWIDARVRQMTDEEGKPVGILGISHDISARKRLEEQIRQAHKMEAIGRLAGGVAHSLNNLMTTVLGYSEVMLGSMKPTDPFFASVQEIKRSSSRTAALTHKLLAFGRKQLLTLRRVDLNAVVSGLEPTLRAMLGRIRLELDLDPGLAPTKADQDHLEEAILVLIRNALDAMPDGGRLTIQTANVELGAVYVQDHPEVCPGPYVMLSVSDTGTGMDAEALGHLFEPFYSPKNVGSESGLGLAAVYGFVKQCGGDIAVQSVPHDGTTFSLYLPRDEEGRLGPQQRV